MRKILFVCMGNICRSPTVHGVFAAHVEARGLQHVFEIDSAGTHGYHTGSPPDVRTRRAARARGYDLSRLRARSVGFSDFENFDLILAMDRNNLEWLSSYCPAMHQHKLRLFLEFVPEAGVEEVPDPYYGGAEGFERVLDLAEAGARALLEDLLADR